MEWSDDAVLLAAKRHGEGGAILDVLTRSTGRWRGFVPGGSGRRKRGILQPGNSLHVTWRARLDEHLGRMATEEVKSRAVLIMGRQVNLAALNAISALLVQVLPEREPHQRVYEAVLGFLDLLADAEAGLERIGAEYALIELLLLGDLGFALDLSHCAVTGETEDLIYVSPRSGRAVSSTAGKEWRDKLLPLPAFLRHGGVANPEDILAGLKTTGFFLERDALQPLGCQLPDARGDFAAFFRQIST